jgi:hypothetical protein
MIMVKTTTTTIHSIVGNSRAPFLRPERLCVSPYTPACVIPGQSVRFHSSMFLCVFPPSYFPWFSFRVFPDSPFTPILFTRPNYLTRFSSVPSDSFFPTSIVTSMMSHFKHFSFSPLLPRSHLHFHDDSLTITT